MQVTHTDLSQIVEGIWSSVLGMEIQSLPAAPDAAHPASMLAACIQISGAWVGSVTLHCSSEVARQAAAVMFDMAEDSLSPGEIQDSLGELVNMVGGSVKSLLPETCILSLPAVVEGTDFSLCVPGASPIHQATFACHGQPVWVTLLERDRAT